MDTAGNGRREWPPAITAVLAAATRAAARAVLVAVSLAALLWAVYGPQGLWTLAWLGVVFVVVTGTALGLHALQPDGGGDHADPA